MGYVCCTGPPPLQLGKGSGLAHDINIPEREAWTKNVPTHSSPFGFVSLAVFEPRTSRVLGGTASLAKRACGGASSAEPRSPAAKGSGERREPRCDLVWDMSVTHCSRCQKQLVEGSIQAVGG